MVARKRLRLGDEYSSDSEDQPIPSSPLRKMHEDDVSGMEAMFRRRKQLKTTTSSSSNSKMIWTKNDELIILGSIVDYEKETKLSYKSDWGAFYGYIKDFIEANFSKKQLSDKIRNLNKRFLDNKARSIDGKGISFTNTDDDEIFKLSMIIWDTDETESASHENIDQANGVTYVEHGRVDENMDQAKDMPFVEHGWVDENMDQEKDVPCVEHERANENINQVNVDLPYVEYERDNENLNQEKVVRSVEHEQFNENIDQAKDVPDVEHERVNENTDKDNVDVTYAEHDPVSNVSMEENDGGEKEKSEEDGVDEFCALQDALEATTLFQNLGKYQQKLLLQNLKTLGAQRRKDLSDEWKALLAEDMKLYAKKLTLSAKLAKAVGDSS